LDYPFSWQEVTEVIKAMPKQKALGPDGFIGAFFRACWDIVKHDMMKAVDQLYNMNQQDIHFLNQALVGLIPKKPNAMKITDFRRISLIHSFGKNISKLMANRLVPELNNLISYNQNQNAFIKKRCIHNNFMVV
jgi:hypothetical protein